MKKSDSQQIKVLPKVLSHKRTHSRVIFPKNPPSTLTPIIPSRHIAKDDSFHNVFEESKEFESQGQSNFTKRLEFYQDYKQITRLTERLNAQKVEITPNIAYLSNLYQKKLRPNTFGIVTSRGKEASIDIRMYSMGDNYAEPFAKGIKHIQSLENINLKANRLTDVGSEKILKSLDIKQIKRINLAENKLGERSLNKLVNMISFYDCRLKHLNLEKTQITSQMLQGLCTGLMYYRRLTKLILAKNGLTDISTRYLKDMLINNSSIKILDLHWNNFSAYGAINLFEGLSKNKSLKIFDISWNSIGKNKQAAESISKCIKTNTSLSHLDLSYNSITSEDAEIIAEGLKSNHTILGLHISGNACKLDTRGFLHPCKKNKVRPCQFYQRIIDRPEFLQEKSKTNCWVCEKWREVVFVCECEGDNVYLHLDIDNFKPEAMPKVQGNRFELYRAVPPTTLSFFFTEINSYEVVHKYDTVVKGYEKTVIYQDGISLFVKANSMASLDATDGNFEVCSIKNPFMTLPRTKEFRYLNAFGQMERIQWTLGISLFKDYKSDNDRILDDCLEFDWRHSRIPNFVKSSEEISNLKNLLRANYALIKVAYKNLSAYGGSDVFSIGSNIFTDFLNECKIFDSNYGLSDLGVNLNSTLIQKEKGQIYNPGNSLVRYEFIEILLRVAVDKYIRSRKSISYVEAFGRLLTEHLVPVMNKFFSQKWRAEKYWVEEVDWVLKAHKPLLNSLFNRYSGKNTLPGKKPFMSLEEYRILCNDAGLIGEHFATREIDVCYSESMMTQVDELYHKRHLEMNFIEMLEALSRAVDTTDIFLNYENFKTEQLVFTPLSKKLELSFRTFIKLCPINFQSDFEFPTGEVYSKFIYKAKV